jgi:AraC-like DNA-binding protein
VLELMRSGRHSLTEIAEMMNYRSIHTFSRAFKKAFGVSPSEYKKRHMQTAEN